MSNERVADVRCDADSLIDLPTHIPIRLQNITCPYCGKQLDRATRTKEHVIGRRFVPRNTLNRQWNLIVWACEPCNRSKATLEDDISAITMQPDLLGHFSVDDTRLVADAQRKAERSLSRRTRKLVKDSHETINFHSQFTPSMTVTMNMTSPAQLDHDRVHALARLHAMAFFYWVTYDLRTRQGGFWQGSFLPINEAAREDWGNDLQIGFMSKVFEWEPRVFASSADGFFKLVIRRHPKAEMWSLAIEWNYKLRVIAAFGNVLSLNEFAKELPKLQMHHIPQGSKNWLRFRFEKPLDKEEDKLFLWKDRLLD